MSKQLTVGGTFKARIRSHAVTESSNQKLPQYAVTLACFEEERMLQNADGSQQVDAQGHGVLGWAPLDDEYTVTDYLPLGFMRDGRQEFSNTFESLQDALGWQPDPARLWESLEQHPIDGVIVQCVCDVEQWEGKNRTKIKFINPVGYTGGIRKMDAPALAKLSNQWGAAFRAKFGTGGPAPAPQPAQAAAPQPQQAAPAPQPAPAASQPAPAPTPAPAPAAAPAASPAAPAPAATGAPVSSKEAVWTYVDANKGAMAPDAAAQEFFRFVKEVTGAETDPQIDALTGEQWGQVLAKIEADGLIPF